VTVVTCMSPTGHFIPPLLVFPRNNTKEELMSDWINPRVPSLGVDTERDFFSQWFLNFSKHTKPTKEDPVILVLDGHYSHTRNLEVITLAREDYVDIICLPPHSSHKMHPLDKALMGPLKTFCCQEIEKWLRSHPGKVVAVYKLANYLVMHTSELQWAKWRLMASGRQASFLVTRTSSDHMISLCPLSTNCCSCEPSCFDKDQQSAILQFC